jgi:hypothetical protein
MLVSIPSSGRERPWPKPGSLRPRNRIGLLGESAAAARLACIALIVAGIVGLKLGSAE